MAKNATPRKTRSTKIKQTTGKRSKSKKISRTKKPPAMSLDAWQTALRKQFGREQQFELTNIGDEPIFSEFQVFNTESNNSYRVAIRGSQPGDNFCACPDFATNTLGTCKHLEFTLAKLERKRGGKKALANGFQPAYSEVYLRYGAQREVCFRPGGDCPVKMSRLAAKYFDSLDTLAEDAFDRFDEFLNRAGKIDHELRCFDDVLAFVAEVRDAHHRRTQLKKAFPRGIRSAAFKKLLSVSLYDYQREGALFAAAAGRTLIGDEMGLGKTIQAIAATEIMAREFGVERVLIICPTSLKHQWEQEIDRFCNRTTEIISGLMTQRQAQFQNDSFYKITNYDTVYRDLEAIGDWSPDLVILDEAQRIKNWKTRTANSIKKIVSPYAIVLTGTPIENRLEELVSIVQFIDRHRLGPTFRFLHDHQDLDENGRVVGYRDLDKIAQTLQPLLIRRQKKQVLDQLPERLEKYFYVPMTEQQKNHHEENADVVARIVSKWQRFGFLSEQDQISLMISLQNMRMSCNSTYLLDQKTDFGFKADELLTVLDEAFEQPDAKVVVFSQWLRTHELIERRIKNRKWSHVMFNGSVPGKKRKGLVDKFRKDAGCRAFLSTDAGGVGLNLQHANIVVNMDLPWNPAVLEQRIGRVHRLGQTRPVQVINFVAEGTIEERMIGLLGFKKSLFSGVLDGGDKNVFMGGSRLKKFMEGVEKVTTNLPTPPVAEPVAKERVEENGAGDLTSTNSDNSAPGDPLSELVQTGLKFLEQFTAPSGGNGKPGSKQSRSPVEIQNDPNTGQNYLKLQLPEPEVSAANTFGGRRVT